MPADPPEEYREPLDKAVEGAFEDEKVWVLYTANGYSDEEAWLRVQVHLEDDFVESLKGKEPKPVPDTLCRLEAYKEYCLKLFNRLHSESLSREKK